MRIELTRQASADVRSIGEAIALLNPDAGLHFLDKLYSKFEMIEAYPGIGRLRPDFGPDVRQFPVGKHLVFYRPISDGIEILRVLHGARQIRSDDILGR